MKISGMRLFKRERDGIWYVQFSHNKYRSLKTKDEKKAKRRFKIIEREAALGNLVFLEKQSAVLLKDFSEEYLAWLSSNRADTTLRTAKQVFSKFLEVVSNKYVSTLAIKDMDVFVSHRLEIGNSPVTVNIDIRTLKAAFSKAVEWAYIKESPFRKYKTLKYHKKSPAFVENSEDIDRIFKYIRSQRQLDKKIIKMHTLLFALYVYTGTRRSEIYKLDWSDVKDTYILFGKRKNYVRLEMPILPQLKAILDEWSVLEKQGRVMPYSIEHIGRVIKSYLRAAGLGHLRPHDLRHTFASHLVMAGVDLMTVQKLLGHSNYKTTEIYAHLIRAHLENAIAKLPY